MIKTMLLTVLSVICFSAYSKDAVIGGIKYRNIDPGPDFVEEARVVQKWSDPAAAPQEKDAGLVIYETSDPGDYVPWRIPREAERLSKMSVALTPGEVTAKWFGVWALEKLDSLDFEVVAPEGITLEIRRIHCWPQRSRTYKSRTFHIVPELLLKQLDGKTEYPTTGGVLKWRDFDLKKGDTSGLWLTVSASRSVKAGNYAGKIIVKSSKHKSLVVPLSITVYPFVLPGKISDKRWILYCWPNRYRAGADPRIDIKSMVEHGIDGFLDNAYFMVDLAKNPDGSLQIKDRASSIKWAKKILGTAREEGMRGPFGLWTTPVNRQLAKIHGIDYHENWPEGMRQDIAVVKKYFDRQYGKLGINDWLSFASDEPKPGNNYAIQAIKAWKAVGAKTYCTAYFGTYIDMAEWLTDPCIGYGDKKSRGLIKKHNSRQWMIGDGCYIGKHEMARHRRRVGVNFYLSGTYGCAIWRWGGSHDDPFNDFDGKKSRAAEPADQLLAYPQMRKANDWKTYIGPIPTIAWESIREGVNDYKYLYVLNQTIKRALSSKSPDARLLAKKDAKVMNELQQVVFASSEIERRNSDVAKFSTKDIANIRTWAAQEIIKLEQAMNGKPIRTTQKASDKFQIKVEPKVNAAYQKNILLPPAILTIPTAEKAPVIDGAVSPAEWQDASTVLIPGSATTEAMIMYDKDNLYVAWVCNEPKISRLIPIDKLSDSGPVWPQDSVEFFITPSASSNTFAHMMINHLGRWISECNGKKSWNANASVAAGHYKDKYIVELALPWKQLAEISPLPWKDVKLNFCRVRNPDNNFFNTNKFNWAYGTGSFHKPDQFGVAAFGNQGIQVVNTSYSIGDDGSLTVSAKVRNHSKHPVFVILKKEPGRRLLLDAVVAKNKKLKGVILPGQTGIVDRKIRLERRSKKWVLSWTTLNDINKDGLESKHKRITFKVPGEEDINPLVLGRKHYIARNNKIITISPFVSPGLRGFLQIKSSSAGGTLIPLEKKSRAKTSYPITVKIDGLVENIMLNHLNKDKKLISTKKVTIINLPLDGSSND